MPDRAGMEPDRKAYWEERWSRHVRPAWQVRSVPTEIEEAVDGNWFPAGGRVLDIGCGSGEIARWLAGRGFAVTGIDVASSAIELARGTGRDVPGLAFKVDDICIDRGRGRFDALLDRGCFQAVGGAKRKYARSVAAVAGPGTPFLLFHAVYAKAKPARVNRWVEDALSDHFTLERATDTVMATLSDQSRAPIRGIVFWLVAR